MSTFVVDITFSKHTPSDSNYNFEMQAADKQEVIRVVNNVLRNDPFLATDWGLIAVRTITIVRVFDTVDGKIVLE